jgi:hypothetical protein
MAKGEVAYHKMQTAMRKSLTHTECEIAYETIRNDFDWVGTTATMSQHTLPLLKHLVGNYTSRDFAHSNKSKSKLKLSQLNSTMLDIVNNATKWDQELYSKVLQDYKIEMWHEAQAFLPPDDVATVSR